MTQHLLYRSSTGKKTAYVPTKDIPSDQVQEFVFPHEIAVHLLVLTLGSENSKFWLEYDIKLIYFQVIVTEKTNILLRWEVQRRKLESALEF